MSQGKISMPSSSGGLQRYYDEYKSKYEFKPQWVIVLVVIIILIEILLHTQGLKIIGVG